MEVPAEIGGRRVVLFGVLAEPIENLSGEPLTVAVAVVSDDDARDFHEALELDAEGRFIAPYEWAILSLDGFEKENPYGVRRWINPPAVAPPRAARTPFERDDASGRSRVPGGG